MYGEIEKKKNNGNRVNAIDSRCTLALRAVLLQKQQCDFFFWFLILTCADYFSFRINKRSGLTTPWRTLNKINHSYYYYYYMYTECIVLVMPLEELPKYLLLLTYIYIFFNIEFQFKNYFIQVYFSMCI